MRFDLSKYPGLSIKSFELIELVGKDSLDALGRAAAPGASLSPAQLSALHLNQMIAQSITHVDDQPVQRPYTAWESWSLRTQEFVVAAYNRLNSTTGKELADFLAQSFATPGAASSPPSSASGPGSPGT